MPKIEEYRRADKMSEEDLILIGRNGETLSIKISTLPNYAAEKLVERIGRPGQLSQLKEHDQILIFSNGKFKGVTHQLLFDLLKSSMIETLEGKQVILQGATIDDGEILEQSTWSSSKIDSEIDKKIFSGVTAEVLE